MDMARGGATWSKVDSSCISEFVFYSDRTPGQNRYILAVRFRDSGRVYEYLGVSPKVYAQLISAPSRGRFLNASIIGKFQFREA